MSSRRRKSSLSITARVVLWYAAIFIITVESMFLLSYWMLEEEVDEKNREVLRARAMEYRAWLQKSDMPSLQQRFYEELSGRQESMFVRVLHQQQVYRIHVPADIAEVGPAEIEVLQRTEETWMEMGEPETGHWLLFSTMVAEGTLLQVGLSTTQSERLLAHTRTMIWIEMAPVILLGVLGGWFITRRSLRPVRELTRTTREIIEGGDMSQRVPTENTRDELGNLVALFNRLLEKNEKLIEAMHGSLDSVAHDLRTPMTRLRNSAEYALQAPDNAAAAQEALADCLEESDRVLSMLNVYMDIAEAQTESMRLDLVELSLAELIHDVVQLYELVAEERRVTVHAELSEELVVRGDRTRMQQVVANLLDNAIKYSKPGGRVEIRADRDASSTRICISDSGIGISAAEIPKIWERLYRGDRSRSERGLGLGLSYVWAIVEAHGGTVTVESTVNEGSTFTVRIPHPAL